MKKQNRHQKVQLVMFTAQLNKIERKVKRQSLKLKTQAIKIHEQERRIQEQSTKIAEQESTIADLRKHMDEWEQKFSDLTAEVRAKDDHHSSKSLIPTTSKFHLSNIKPRRAQVLPKSFSAIHAELERKRKCASPFEVPPKLARSMSSNDYVGLKATDFRSQYQEKDGNPTNVDLLCRSKSDIGTFTSSIIGTLLNNPITCIKSRKRKMEDVIELD